MNFEKQRTSVWKVVFKLINRAQVVNICAVLASFFIVFFDGGGAIYFILLVEVFCLVLGYLIIPFLYLAVQITCQLSKNVSELMLFTLLALLLFIVLEDLVISFLFQDVLDGYYNSFLLCLTCSTGGIVGSIISVLSQESTFKNLLSNAQTI